MFRGRSGPLPSEPLAPERQHVPAVGERKRPARVLLDDEASARHLQILLDRQRGKHVLKLRNREDLIEQATAGVPHDRSFVIEPDASDPGEQLRQLTRQFIAKVESEGGAITYGEALRRVLDDPTNARLKRAYGAS